MSSIPKKRNGFYYRNSNEYTSITKMIGEVIAKPELFYWAGLTTAQIALKNPNLTDKEVMAEFQLQNKKTQERGIGLHNIAERFETVKPEEVLEHLRGYYDGLVSWWSTFKPSAQ